MARSQAAEAWAVTDFPYSLADLFAAIQGNPVGTERIGDPSLTNPTPGVQPAANWGGYPVSQNLYNAAQNGIGTALGFVGGTEGAGPIRAFHGSPYDFDAFDMSKIGTGEGAQAYGHGLYFAQNEGTAKAYRDALKWRGTDWNDPNYVAGFWNNHFGDPQKAADYLQGALKSQSTPEAKQAVQGAIDLLQSGAQGSGSANPGTMYEVALHTTPDQLLDWDKPLSQQSPQVQQALQDNANLWVDSRDTQVQNAAKDVLSVLQRQPENMTGQSAWQAMVRMHGGDAAAAARAMQGDAGLSGIQYLDQGSRAAGEGSRNYVMFDPKLIEILRKYLFPATTVGGAAALGANQAQAALTPQGQKLVPSRPPQQSQQDQSWPVPTPPGAWAPMPWSVTQ